MTEHYIASNTETGNLERELDELAAEGWAVVAAWAVRTDPESEDLAVHFVLLVRSKQPSKGNGD